MMIKIGETRDNNSFTCIREVVVFAFGHADDLLISTGQSIYRIPDDCVERVFVRRSVVCVASDIQKSAEQIIQINGFERRDGGSSGKARSFRHENCVHAFVGIIVAMRSVLCGRRYCETET